jgi:hypothetical protein
MILQDSTGWYDLRTVSAVKPHPVRQFTTPEGKTHPAPPVLKVVAALHMFGEVHVTDTLFSDVIAIVGPAAQGGK